MPTTTTKTERQDEGKDVKSPQERGRETHRSARDRAAQKTCTVTDRSGTELEVPCGVDGKNPVSPNNPHPKAVIAADFQAAKEATLEITEDEDRSAEKGR